MSNELSDTVGIFDSREKNSKRIDSFCSFIETHGGITEKGTLKLCDYHISGSFKGKPVNLGIEAKSLSDFASSYQDLPDKLGRAYEFYSEVGLFVEVYPYTYSKEADGFHSTIINREVPDGSANVLNLAAFMNSLASWQHEGVHVRQLISPEQFGDALVSVLVYITKDTHNGLNPITKQSDNIEDISKWRFVNALIHLGVKNLGVKTALKFRQWLIDNNYPPNLHFATSIDGDWLQEILGVQIGKDLNEAFRSRAGWVWIDSKPNPIPSQAKPLNERTPKLMSNEQGTEKSLKSSLNQSQERKITDSNKKYTIPMTAPLVRKVLDDFNEAKQFLIVFLNQNPRGIKYDDITYALNLKLNFKQVSDVISELIQEGQCYEPKFGLIVPTNPINQKSQLPEEHINQDSLKTKEVKAVLQSSKQGGKGLNNTVEYPCHVYGTHGMPSVTLPDESQLSDARKEPDSQAGNPACEMPTEVNLACSRSLSTEQLQNQSAEVIPQLKKELSTHDTLSQSSNILGEESHTKDLSSSELQKLSNCDTHDKLQSSGVTPITPFDTTGDYSKNTTIVPTPPVVKFHEVTVRETVKSLEDAIVDYVYDKPISDTEIITTFQMKGFKIPEIHKVIKDSKKLWKYKQGTGIMVSYHGVKADKDIDIGV